MRALKSVFAVFVAAACFAAAVASAQSPATSAAEAERAKQQQQRQQTQPLNNQPVWSEVRSGAPQTTTVVGRETNILIQPQGQTWRTLRNGEISIYGGWGLVLVLLAIAAVYWRKGTVELHEPLTGRKIRRFSPWERAIHWAVAISFSILAISGLIILFGKNLLLPLIGYTLFSWLAILSKNLHNFVGPLFIVCLFLFVATFIRNMFPKSYDVAWLVKLGGLFSAKEVPAGKFNAGQKLWFWGGALFLGAILAGSGLVLDFANFNQTRSTMQTANVVHVIAATLFMMAGLGHIYLGTIGVGGAYESMRYGYVDETWAKEHHEYWYNDIKAGRIPADEVVEPPLTERVA